MNRPPIGTMIIGHPLVTGVATVTGLVAAAAAWQTGDSGWLISLTIVAIVAAVVKANEAATAYKNWKREWDAMAEPATRRKYGIASWLFAITIWLGVLLFLCQDSQTRSVIVGIALVLGSPIALFLTLRWLWRRLAFRRRRGGPRHVTVIARPLFATPSLAQAYALLPNHCQRILARPQP